MERDWALSAFPLETSVLKLPLRPYSCGHEILLSQIGSPFAIGGEVDRDDLFIAVLICSQSFKDGCKTVQSPRKARLLCWFWRFFAGSDLHSELAAFNQYLSDGRWSPPVNELRHGWTTRTLKAPRVYRLIPTLCSQLGLTEAQALDFPMSRANVYAAALADKDGTIDLSGGKQENALAAHLANLEARAAKGEPVWDF